MAIKEVVSEEEKQWLLSIPEVLQYFEYLKNQDKEFLALQLAKLMAALDRVDEETRYLIMCIFRPFRIVQRNYTGREGLLWRIKFSPEDIYILEEAEWKDYGKNKIIKERRVSKHQVKYILGYEEILWKEEREEEQQQQYY